MLKVPVAKRSRGVGVLMIVRMTHCLAFFLIHTPEQHRLLPYHTKNCAMSRQLFPLQEWSLFTTDSSRPGVRGNINTSDTETSILKVHLSLGAIFAFVVLFWSLLHDSKLPLGATDFSLHKPKPDHGN